MIAVALVTAFHVVFGFTGPARSLRAGMGSILGFSLVFGASALAAYGAVLALLATPLLGWLRSARNADPALLRAVRVVLTVIAVASVAIVTLGTFGLIPTIFLASQSLMNASLEVGTVSIAANAVATALAVVFATVVLTGVTGFILDREIVPRLKLRPGAGYAVVTFTRWTMILVGTALALAALGIDMAKVTLLAGAIGVGIGFGLQNVVNNFVSGLILIIERPVGVGDLIEMGSLTGEVKRIGIRSSTVRTAQGAEVIVPNGELLSKEVVNWTRSDRQRRYDIDVGVAYGSEPEQVMRLLVEAARDVPEIMTDPAPRALFKGFGDSSLDFRLLAWVQTVDVGLQAQNALRVAILQKARRGRNSDSISAARRACFFRGRSLAPGVGLAFVTSRRWRVDGDPGRVPHHDGSGAGNHLSWRRRRPMQRQPAGSQNRPLRVATRAIAPFVLPKTDPPAGFSIDLWTEVARRMQVEFTWKVRGDAARPAGGGAQRRCRCRHRGHHDDAGAREDRGFLSPVFRFRVADHGARAERECVPDHAPVDSVAGDR